ncbi:MAG: phosphoglycerate mutase [Planctomycetota bacterium]|nr:MAG: phosphoglycerate mutase [Planctomycetota bacterium]
MPQLFFLRHAESEANAKHEYAGQLPIPLSTAGHKEAERTAKMLKKDVTIHAILSSTLQRALQTAFYFVDEYNIPMDPAELIVEQDMGVFAGQTYENAHNSKYFENDTNNRWNWKIPESGESYSMIADRVLKFLKGLEHLPKEQNILIITHGVTLRLIKGALENTLPIYNTSLTRNCEIFKTQFEKLGIKHQLESIYYLDPNSVAHRE